MKITHTGDVGAWESARRHRFPPQFGLEVADAVRPHGVQITESAALALLATARDKRDRPMPSGVPIALVDKLRPILERRGVGWLLPSLLTELRKAGA